MTIYVPKLVSEVSEISEIDGWGFTVTTSNPATILMLLSLAQVFQLKHNDLEDGLEFGHEKEQVAKAAHASMSQLHEFDPPLAQLEVPRMDARVNAMITDINRLAIKYATSDGIMILEGALLKILDIENGSIAYAESDSSGFHSAPMIPGMRHLMGLHWINNRQLLNLHMELDSDAEF